MIGLFPHCALRSETFPMLRVDGVRRAETIPEVLRMRRSLSCGGHPSGLRVPA